MKFKSILVRCVASTLFITTATVTPVHAFTSYELDSDLNYKYKGADAPEFYNYTGTEYNYNGAMPYYLQQIYGANGQYIYNSNFGTNIVDLNGYGTYSYNTYGYGYGINYENYNASVESNYFDSIAGGGQFYDVNTGSNESNVNTGNTGTGANNQSNSQVNGVLPNEVGDVTFPSYFADTNYSYNNHISANKDIKLGTYNDGSIGIIKIANAKLEVKAYDYSDIYQSMKKGVGHMDSTAYWNGNAVFFGHNRGSNGYFSKLKNVEVGDIVEYTTKEGTRKYKVDRVERISETDWSDISYTVENKITLITCIENTPSQRLLVQATEVK